MISYMISMLLVAVSGETKMIKLSVTCVVPFGFNLYRYTAVVTLVLARSKHAACRQHSEISVCGIVTVYVAVNQL